MTITAGLDVGGAHLKVALVEHGRTIAVEQVRCRLWMGLDKLDTAFKKAAPLLSRADRFAVTMTGELSDLFPNRKAGVETLVDLCVREFGAETQFWMGRRGFGSAAEAKQHHIDTGSTNFLATATWIARHHPNALLIDFGSTTTDIIPIVDGKPAPRGHTDAERQTTGELVYTGYTRTAVMGVTNRAPFKGQWVSLAREHLATMADVRRVIGSLPDDADLHTTADGKGKSVEESTTRLARMLGWGPSDGTLEDWKLVAEFIRQEQWRSIIDGMLQVLSSANLSPDHPVITAGIGKADIQHLVLSLGRREVHLFNRLAPQAGVGAGMTSDCAPAVAVALLLECMGIPKT